MTRLCSSSGGPPVRRWHTLSMACWTLLHIQNQGRKEIQPKESLVSIPRLNTCTGIGLTATEHSVTTMRLISFPDSQQAMKAASMRAWE